MSKWFCTSNKKRTAFYTGKRLWQLTVVPFDHCNVQEIFEMQESITHFFLKRPT
jgi:hypothetical protein